MKSKWLAACSVVALVAAAAFAGAVNYQLLKKVPVPGAGGWDYLSVDDAADASSFTSASNAVSAASIPLLIAR